MSTTLPRPPAQRERSKWAFLRQRGWIGGIIGVLAFTAACWLILAPWQFSRASERSTQNNQINSSMTQTTPLPIDRLTTTTEPPSDLIWREVTATGVFDPSRQVYVRLRQDANDDAESEIVLPMRLTDGTVILVDRGYWSLTNILADLAPPPVPTGQVTVTGLIQDDETDPAHRPAVHLANRTDVYAVNAPALAGTDAAPGTLRLGYIQLTSGAPGVLQAIGIPQTDSGPYFSYALQWCAFGAMAPLALGYWMYREVTDPRDDDESQVDAQDPDGTDPADGDPHNPAELAAPARRASRRRGGFDRSTLYDQDSDLHDQDPV